MTIDGRVAGAIEAGLLLLVGFRHEDAEPALEWMADKVCGLRIFSDDEGKMNRSVEEVGGGILVVSQFTLYGDVRRGRRPSFDAAAAPADARELYEAFVRELRLTGLPISTGEFQAMMQVELVNDGPVTILVDSRRHF